MPATPVMKGPPLFVGYHVGSRLVNRPRIVVLDELLQQQRQTHIQNTLFSGGNALLAHQLGGGPI